MPQWTPNQEGRDFGFTPILKPLEPFRADVQILTGLAHRTSEGSAGDHARAGGTYLTGVCPKRTTSANVEVGVSVDQLAAQAIGKSTRLASLELGCEATRMVGSCDAGYRCAYINSMPWRNATTPNPPETNPRLVLERLFGSLDPDTAGHRASALDFIRERTADLNATLGAADRRKLDEYLTAVRDVERRLDLTAGQSAVTAATPVEKPSGVPSGFVKHVRLMQDLLLIALQSDLTRVVTLIYAKERSNRSYPELGFSDPHHPLTHHRNNDEWIDKVARINRHHVEQFA